MTQMKADEAGLAKLRGQLLATARKHGLHPNDVEDVVQEALIKVWREKPRQGAPKLEVRGRKALKDKRAEFYRHRSRRPSEVSLEEELDRAQDRPPGEKLIYEEEVYHLIELAAVIKQILPQDARAFALLKMLKSTEADVVKLMKWPQQKAAAARVQRGRKKGEVARALLDALSTGEED